MLLLRRASTKHNSKNLCFKSNLNKHDDEIRNIYNFGQGSENTSLNESRVVSLQRNTATLGSLGKCNVSLFVSIFTGNV